MVTWMALFSLLPAIISFGISCFASRVGINRVLKIILFRALKSALNNKIAWSFSTDILFFYFSSIIETPLVHHGIRVAFLIDKFANIHLMFDSLKY